jgi:DNA polymerase-3 subunit chi
MTRVDFYQLSPGRHQIDQLACQLCQKAYDSNQKTLLLTQNEEHSRFLDRQLWTFSDDSFLPHDCNEVKELITPILIQHQPNPRGDRQLLINLSDSVPEYFAQFDRVIEFVSEENKDQARQHYSFYQERGYPLKHVAL